MSTEHFNELTEAQQERLVILAEEASEVIKCVAKILRHGLNSNNKGLLHETNREALSRECGDFMHALDRCAIMEDLDLSAALRHSKEHSEYIKQYLHHQGPIDV